MRTLTGEFSHVRLTGPAETAAHVLDRFFGRLTGVPDSTRSPLPLAGFQADAVARILRLLTSRGGALLADSVGLGKTHVAMAVIERSISSGVSPVLVVTPAALRRQWVRPLRQLARQGDWRLGLPGLIQPAQPDPTLEWCSHARLARGHLDHRQPQLVVVDEAHAFRNPQTRRYRELARLCLGAQVLLLTATPINNSLSDLYFQLRLFLGDGDLADLGIPDLHACLRRERGGPRPGDRLLRTAIAALTVRRTRRVLESASAGHGLRFPFRDPPIAVRYDLESGMGVLGLEVLIREIEGLRFRAHGPGSGRPGRRTAIQLLRFFLLKRLESSSAAFNATVRRLASFLRECALAIPTGKLPMRDGSNFADPDQLLFGPLLHRDLPRGTDIAALAKTVAADLDRVRRMQAVLDSAGPVDPKVAALLGLLRGPLVDRSALIFTEFRDTAIHLHRALLPHRRIGLVTGREALLGTGRVPRRRVIDAFAPVASGVDVAPESRVDVLVATDVLAEGLNLQDCADVVSFDLPWNPVRLVQRIGRIDRLGSVHDRIRIYNFMPDRGLENILGLLDRIRSKLEAIRAAGNFDTPALDEPGAGVSGLRTVLGRLQHSDPALLADLEAEAEAGFELEEQVHAVARRPGYAGRGPTLPHGRSPPATSSTLWRSAEPPVAAVLDRPVGEAGGWLVVASDRGIPRFLFVNHDQVREDRSAALVILAEAAGPKADSRASAVLKDTAAPGSGAAVAAMSDDGSGPAEMVAAAAHFLRRQRGAPARTADPAGRAAGLLLQRLRQIPGGASAAECGRADAILERLRPGVGWGATAALEGAILEERNRSSGPGTCAAFMDRLESLLSRPRDRAAPPPGTDRPHEDGADGPRLVALFRLAPALELVLEPEHPR